MLISGPILFKERKPHKGLQELHALRSKGRLTKEQNDYYNALQEETKNRYSERITDDKGNLNLSAVMIREVPASDEACAALTGCLKTEIEEELLWMCLPIYRDAILFYDAYNKLVDGINICFECDRIESIQGRHIQTDFKTFKYLKQLLLHLGHPIADPDSFKADYLMELISKNKTKTNKPSK